MPTIFFVKKNMYCPPKEILLSNKMIWLLLLLSINSNTPLQAGAFIQIYPACYKITTEENIQNQSWTFPWDSLHKEERTYSFKRTSLQ